MVRQTIIFIVFVIVIIATGSSQPTAIKRTNDSLLSIWNKTSNHDTIRLAAMYFLAWDQYLFSKPDSSIYYANKMYALAKRINNKKYLGYALSTLGTAQIIRGNYFEAVKYFKKALDLDLNYGCKHDIAASLNNLGIAFKKQGNYKKAIEYYTRGLKYLELTTDKVGLANTLNNIGNIYGEQGDMEKAFEYYERAFSLLTIL